jgi:hypothetical protein
MRQDFSCKSKRDTECELDAVIKRKAHVGWRLIAEAEKQEKSKAKGDKRKT